MCWMLGAVHHEYQCGIQQHENAGKHIVAVRPKELHLKGKIHNDNVFRGRQNTLTGLACSAESYYFI